MKTVILDAGHGGLIDGEYQTAGKRSPIWDDGSQYFEGVGNRLIRERIAKLLVGHNVSVSYTDTSESDISLGKRIQEVNRLAKLHGPKNCLLISIHSNGFNKDSAHGWSVYTTKGTTKSDTYAEALYEEIKDLFPNEKLRTDKSDGDLDIESNFYMLRKSICPAILSENFFHTNKRECKKILMTKFGREKIAKAHVNMIKRFINKN